MCMYAGSRYEHFSNTAVYGASDHLIILHPGLDKQPFPLDALGDREPFELRERKTTIGGGRRSTQLGEVSRCGDAGCGEREIQIQIEGPLN